MQPDVVDDVSHRRILLMLAGFAAVIALAVLAVWGLLAHWRFPLVQAPAPAPHVEGPLQESAPQLSLQEYLDAEQKLLDSMGWVDRRAGIAHVPIDVAVRMLEQGHGKRAQRTSGSGDAEALSAPPPAADAASSAGHPRKEATP